MATWDETILQSRTVSPPPSMAQQAMQVFAVGLVVLMLASGPYWVLRTVLPQSQAAVSLRIGALEVVPSARAWLPGSSRSRLGRFVVAFGRFSHRQSAEAHARFVRSKGYVARVQRVGETYLVLSRSYRSLADATFWSSVFSRIGLEAQAVAGPEAFPALEPVPAL